MVTDHDEIGPPPFVDVWMPAYDVQSLHSTPVRAPAAAVYRAARNLDLSSSWVTRVLLRLRGMPASALNADGLARIRFKPLYEQPPRGFVLGIIGQFWRINGRLQDFDPTGFQTWQQPGFARAIWSFDVTATGDETSHLRTVTRVHCTDGASRRRFGRYWRLVGPFSGIIRHEALKAIRRRAEADGDASTVILRDVEADDLPILFEHQRDPVANQMAAFPPREREGFLQHWRRNILGDDAVIKKTILHGGRVAGNIVCYQHDGRWLVGYWIGRASWGQGVATRALSLLVREVAVRPLVAYVAQPNTGSIRVLEKCGFQRSGEVLASASGRNDGVDEFIYTLHDTGAA